MGVKRLAALLLALLPAGLPAQMPAEWTRPVRPFHIIGPVWYVGTEGLAAYLVKTREGAILLDGTLAANAGLIRRNIERMGVPIRQVRVILLSHAHHDHAAGIAALKAASGARLEAGARDAGAMSTGTQSGETSYGNMPFPAARVDRALQDSDRISLGGTTLSAIATPGHTPGCTSYGLTVTVQRRPRDVLFLCSLTVAGNKLVANRRHPAIVADYRATFDKLARRHADVVLPFHPELADVLGRGQRGDEAAFVDSALLPRLVADARTAFERDWRKQTMTVR